MDIACVALTFVLLSVVIFDVGDAIPIRTGEGGQQATEVS